MNLASVKDFLFRHCEKLLAAAVLLFVVKVVYSYATAPETMAKGGFRGGPAPAGASAAVRPYLRRTIAPYVEVPDVTAPLHDWFHPPRIRRLPPVQLDLKKKPRVRIALDGRAVGAPRVAQLSAEELQSLPRLKTSPGRPCQVVAELAPGTRDAVMVTARETGNWRKYEVRLENEDRVWLYVVVAEPEDIIQSKVAPPKVLSISEEPLGVVHIKFTIPKGQVRDADRHTVTKYIEPTHFIIVRKSEFDPEFRQVGRVEAQLPEAEPGGAPRSPGAAIGLPGLPGLRPPRRPAPPRPTPAEEQKPREFEFVDKTVESETYYVYKIQSVAAAEPPVQEPMTAESPQVEYQTKAKFSFAYTGGGATRANIIVFIGSREAPQDYKKFQVRIGQRIGAMPPELQKSSGEQPPEEEGGRASAKPQGAEHETEYVTRFVLVDIVQRVFRVVPQVRRIPDGIGLDGRPKFKKVVVYREESANQVILRDRRNRLLRLWFEHEKSVIPPAK